MYRTMIRMKSSILMRASAIAVAVAATLGGTLIAAAPAGALPPRPGKLPCTLKMADGGLASFLDGSEMEITITFPPSQGGGTAKVRYRCDDGKWVEVSGIARVLNGSILSTAQSATITDSANRRVAVKGAGALSQTESNHQRSVHIADRVIEVSPGRTETSRALSR